jgi:hypothetical protein
MHCGHAVVGNGYTNHCPECLWSRHVDINPGDRGALCKGGMPPIAAEFKGGEWIITHRCERCGFERRQRSIPEDSMESLIEIARG